MGRQVVSSAHTPDRGRRQALVGPGDSGIPQQVGIDQVLRRPSVDARPSVDDPQPRGEHQSLPLFPAHSCPPPLQLGLHPPGPVEEGRLQILLSVHLSRRGHVPGRGSAGTVVDAGSADAQQLTLPTRDRCRCRRSTICRRLAGLMDRTSPPRNPAPPSAGRSPGTGGRSSRHLSWPPAPHRCRKSRGRVPQEPSSKPESARDGIHTGRPSSITTTLLQFSTLFTGNCFVAGKGTKLPARLLFAMKRNSRAISREPSL